MVSSINTAYFTDFQFSDDSLDRFGVERNQFHFQTQCSEQENTIFAEKKNPSIVDTNIQTEREKNVKSWQHCLLFVQNVSTN